MLRLNDYQNLSGFNMIRWTHLTITVTDLPRSIEFYTSVCGLSVVRDRREEGGGTVWLGRLPLPGQEPSFVLVLMPGEVKDRVGHLGFQCESREQVDQIARRADEQGILEQSPRDSGGVVGYWTIIRDPDEHLVEFTHGQPIEGI